MSTLPYAPSSSSLSPTLIDLCVPTRASSQTSSRSLLTDLALILAGSLFTAALAQISIPFVPVPFTGQTLAVLLTGAVLGARRGFLAQALYLSEAIAGLPVTANHVGGLPFLLGPTIGYAAMFPFAAGLTGYLAQRRWDRSLLRSLLAMILATALILIGGALNLTRFVPLADVPAKGILPFLPGEALKIALATLLLPTAWRFVGRK
jgi:biotin transport system substrate-specific component